MKYQTAEKAAEFIGKRVEENDREKVVSLLEGYLDQNLESEDEIRLYYGGGQIGSVGVYIDSISDCCCKEAGVSHLSEPYDLKISKEVVWDYMWNTHIPRFRAEQDDSDKHNRL